MPKVSVIMPAYNAARTVGKAIGSALGQTMSDLEVVVVDDGSRDETCALVEALAAKDSRVRLIRQPQNGGPAVARNTAIDNAKGEWIALLDSDDWYEPQRLEIMLKAATAIGADVVYDNVQIYDHAVNAIVDRTYYGSRRRISVLTAKMFIANDDVMRSYSIGYLQPLVRRDFLNQHKLRYDPKYRIGEDFLFQLEMLLRGGKGVIVPGAHYVYVYWMSPTTRAKSPFSQSTGGKSGDIIRGCDEILAKYGAGMTAAERAALKDRRRIFKSRIQCDFMMAALRERKFGEAVKILIARPHILVLNLTSFGKLLRAHTLNLLRKIKGVS